MNKDMLARLNESERQLVLETEKPNLARLDEDSLVDLMGRVRRARNKASGQYRRGSAARVAEKGGRGAAGLGNSGARDKVEVLEEALTRVTTALAAHSRKNASSLKAERLAAARGEASAPPAGSAPKATRKKATPRPAPKRTRSDSAAVSKKNASTLATGARRQAKRDSR